MNCFCGLPAKARGLCKTCWQREKRNGNLMHYRFRRKHMKELNNPKHDIGTEKETWDRDCKELVIKRRKCHILTEKDEMLMQATCAICGQVKINRGYNSLGRMYYYCSNRSVSSNQLWLSKIGREAYSAKMREYGKKPKYRYRTLLRRAHDRSIHFELTLAQCEQMWSQPCYYCGGTPKLQGIDRVDSNRGYVISNCVSCCRKCNVSKMDMNIDEYIQHCHLIASRFPSQTQL
ncbi:Zn-finger containing protein [Caudoviricetes sp.]|nr:Zn-finger containing protein [Caudoviricetes sp.]